MVLTFASVQHSVQNKVCWTVLTVFALNSLAVRDFVERYKKDGDAMGLPQDHTKITPRLYRGHCGQIPQDFIGISTLRNFRTSVGHAVLGFAELHVRKRAV